VELRKGRKREQGETAEKMKIGRMGTCQKMYWLTNARWSSWKGRTMAKKGLRSKLGRELMSP
jgi:hypothetical protein